MDLHPGEEVSFEGHPSWRALLSFYIYGLLGIAVLTLILVLADVSTGIVVAIAVALVALVVLAGFVHRVATSYVVTNQRLYIRRGILSKRIQQTRIDRVQNVNTDQTFLQRVLFVGTVDFDTAGTDDSEFRFAGIANPGRVVEAVDRAQRDATSQQAPPT